MKVLFPVDGSNRSLHTIQEAAEILNREGVEAHFVYVLLPEYNTTAEINIDRELADAFLEKARRTARESGFKPGNGLHIYDTDVSEAICIYANQNGMDMIVMGSHGYQGLEKILMGSVSEAILKHAEQPVIILRNDKTHTIELSHTDKVALKADCKLTTQI